jgi:cell wall-associated NlpC family hydrolase
MMSKTIHRLLLLVLSCISLVPVTTADPLEDLIRQRGGNSSQAQSQASKELAGDLIGLSYRYGGNNPNQGLDCSAFMQYIFKQSMRVSLPRTASEQFGVGSSVDRSSLQPGDMVFFRTAGPSRISHVGMYIGGDRFIHAPRTGKNIEITSITSKYWSKTYAGARRVSGAGKAASFVR